MPEWLWALVVGVIVMGLVAYIWRVHEDRDRERYDDLWRQIGRTSKEGMREIVHKSANALSQVSLTSRDHERRIKRIENYLNGKLNRHEDER